MNQAAEIRRRQAKAQADLKTLDRAGLVELKAIYAGAADALNQRLIGLSDGGVVRIEYLQTVITALDSLMTGAREQSMDLIGVSVTNAAVAGASVGSAEAIAASTNAAHAVLGAGEDGLTLSQRLWRVNTSARRDLADAVQRAIVRGDGAYRASRDLVEQGLSVSREILDTIGGASPSSLSKLSVDKLVTGEGSAMSKVQRVFRTEIARAHTLAYVDSVDDLDDVVGYRFNLSSAHKQRDICDLHAGVNLHGLGEGVYPKNVINRIFPAHPNTTSFVTAVFADEVTDADKQKDSQRVEWLRKQSAAMQDDVLGKQKGIWFRQGKITERLIGSTVKALKKRFGE